MRRGVKLPPGTKYVGRPTKWGNPWKVGQYVGPDIDDQYQETGARIDNRLAVELYRAALNTPYLSNTRPRRIGGLYFTVDEARAELAGYDLACYCELDEPCHADVLLQLLREGAA